MLQAIQIGINRFFNKGHERTVRARKNIVRSVLLKGGSVLVSLMLVPLTLHYVDATQYGVWLTLSSVIAWAAFFDIGLGNGLRNQLAAKIAVGDVQAAQSYVSTTYAILAIIAVVVFGLFCLVNPLINWASILNVPASVYPGLGRLVLILFGFFCLQFVLQLLNNVLTANQQPAVYALLNFIGQALILVLIFLLTRFSHGDLMRLALVMMGAPLLVLLIAGFWFYRGSYKAFAPKLSAVNFAHARQLLSTGGAFFIIQIGALVLFETDNIVITQLFGPQQVTTFNVAYKLFSVVTMFFTIIITPYWSAFTEAYAKQDMDWIRIALSKLNKICMALSVASVVLLIASPVLCRLWTGDAINVPLTLSAAMCLYNIVFVWQTVNVYLLNGIGKIRLQLYLVVISAIVNIPLAIVLGRWIGVAGVTLANALLFVVMGSIFAWQVKQIITGKASGVFNK